MGDIIDVMRRLGRNSELRVKEPDENGNAEAYAQGQCQKKAPGTLISNNEMDGAAWLPPGFLMSAYREACR